GLSKIYPILVICALPSTCSNPTGFCINEFADKIQNADNIVPNETNQIDSKLTLFDKRSQPNTQIHKNIKSKKKAAKDSIASDGPKTSPTNLEYVDQFIPNWNSCKIPVTTPTAKLIKNNTPQNFAILLYTSSPLK